MSFSDHLDNFIKQRDQQPQSSTRQSYRRQPAIQDATGQSKAREAMAKAQDDASVRATIETKAPHVRIHGRCVTEQEAYTLELQQVQPTPVSQSRLDYIQQLRKDLKLRKHSD